MRRTLLTACAAALLLVPATAPAYAASGEWAQVGGDAGGTGYQPNTGGLNAANADDLAVDWTSTDLGATVGTVYASGSLYVASTDGLISRVDPSTGDVEETVVEDADRRFRQLALVGGTFYVRGTDVQGFTSYLAAYRADGTRRWEKALPAGTQEAIDFTVAGGRLAIVTGANCLAGTCDHTLHVFATADGRRLWSRPVTGEAFYAPAIVGKLVYVWAWRAGYGSHTTAYAVDTGARRWAARTGSRPTGWSNALYTGGLDGLCSWTPSSGARRWCRTGTASNGTNLALGPSTIYATRYEERSVVALHRDGTPRWTANVAEVTVGGDPVDLRTPLVTGGGVVYVYVEHTGDIPAAELVALRADTGAELSRVSVDDPPPGPVRLVLAGGRLFVDTGLSLLALAP